MCCTLRTSLSGSQARKARNQEKGLLCRRTPEHSRGPVNKASPRSHTGSSPNATGSGSAHRARPSGPTLWPGRTEKAEPASLGSAGRTRSGPRRPFDPRPFPVSGRSPWDSQLQLLVGRRRHRALAPPSFSLRPQRTPTPPRLRHGRSLGAVVKEPWPGPTPSRDRLSGEHGSRRRTNQCASRYLRDTPPMHGLEQAKGRRDVAAGDWCNALR